jgi:uncharacterized protein (TIGR02001 family)
MKRLAKCCTAVCATISAGSYAAPVWAQSDDTDPPADFEISGNVALVSDYRFRGLSYSNNDPALQGGIDISHKSGFFIGTWASSLADNGGANLELDLYGGYAGQAAGIDYSVTFLGYVYPGVKGSNYYELKGTAAKTLGPATLELTVAWVPDQQSFPGDNVYVGAAASVGVPNTPVSLRAAVGRETGGYDNKWDWEAGASYTFGKLTAAVSYIDSNYGGVDEAGRAGRGAVVASLLAEF